MRRALFAALLATLATAARAQPTQSPRWGSFELSAGTYRPDIDSEFPGGVGAFTGAFGTGRSWLFRAAAARNVFTGYGTLEVGLGTGYMKVSGRALKMDGTRSGDTTTLKMIPTSLNVTYRLDTFADRYGIPLAPYGRFAFERYNWWINDADGNRTQSGATNGWSVGAGLALMLDFFDPGLARELDQDNGINHTYLFGELRKTYVDDFGSSTSWNMSDSAALTWTAGLLFVF